MKERRGHKLISSINDVLIFDDTSLVDLTDIKKNNNKYDWKNSIGCKIKFRSKNNFSEFIDGEVKINDYNYNNSNPKLCVKYNDSLYNIFLSSIMLANFTKVLHKEFKYEVGDTFCDNKGNITIIDKKRISVKLRTYKYHCNKCGYEDWKNEIDFEKGKITRCPVCCVGVKKIIPGINDISTTDTWMVNYFPEGLNQAKLYSSGSSKIIDFVCPYCGKTKSMTINALHQNGFGCICGDGFSYPEKLIAALLDSLNIRYKHQLSRVDYNWIESYYYDFYLLDYNTIIETHGSQHYTECSLTSRTLEEEQNNDRIKRNIALNNNISNYIEIDCRYSNLEYIKQSILKSDLFDILKINLDNINWINIDKNATSNKIKEICQYYENNKNIMYKKEIAQKYNISRYTLMAYLEKGNTFGWCNYNKDGKIIAIQKRSENIIEVVKDSISLGIYNSAKEIELISESKLGVLLQANTIMMVIRGTYPCDTYKGFKFNLLQTI